MGEEKKNKKENQKRGPAYYNVKQIKETSDLIEANTLIEKGWELLMLAPRKDGKFVYAMGKQKYNL